VADYIDANLDGALNILALSNLVHLSPRHYVRIFSNTFGTTPHRYIMNQRVGRAKELISKGRSLVEVAAVVGFASQSHLSFAFRQTTGMSPGRFRSNWVHGSNKAIVASAVSSAADKARISNCL
jgi:AraC family transcriptional regulator